MKRALPLALAALFSLVACSPTSTAPDVAATDAARDTDAPVADATPDSSADSAADAGPAYPLPSGYTLTPFLSDTADAYVFDPPASMLVAGRDYIAVIDSDAGRLVLDLAEVETPITVNSFVFLARHHFYDGQAFHRVIDGFVAQGGDPLSITDPSSSWGTGGPGYHFTTEVVPSLRFDGAGVLGMARAMSLDSNGSQFFITLAATPSLNDMYTVFGRVLEGIEVLPMIVRGQPPATPTRMTRVYIGERAR